MNPGIALLSAGLLSFVGVNGSHAKGFKGEDPVRGDSSVGSQAPIGKLGARVVRMIE